MDRVGFYRSTPPCMDGQELFRQFGITRYTRDSLAYASFARLTTSSSLTAALVIPQ